MFDLSLAGRLAFVHHAPTKPPLPPGRNHLGLYAERDTVLYVPEGIDAAKPTPLVVLFHGGGGSAQKILPHVEPHAEREKFLLMAPQSMFPTWDIVIAGNGPDRERLDESLAAVADRYTLDPTHLAFMGHSDGASYALSTGLSNGRIVSHVMANSGGFMTVLAQEGAPRVFIAHGRQDEQCPIDRSGRANATRLKNAGYDVTYVEFDGPHAIQPENIACAIRFFVAEPVDPEWLLESQALNAALQNA